MKTILVLALAGCFANAFAAETIRYDIHVESGKKVGEQVVEIGDDGLTRVRYGYKNNGRGPDLTETYRVGPDGTFTEYSVKGR